MKAQIAYPPFWKIIADRPEIPPPTQPSPTQTDARDSQTRSKPKKKEPQWQCTDANAPPEPLGEPYAKRPEPQNLTLDELKEWLAEAEREEGITQDDETAPPL